MAELGWLGIHLPEEHGGAGAGLSELIAVLDELGRQVAPGPFLPTVLASAVVAQCGNDEQRALFLPHAGRREPGGRGRPRGLAHPDRRRARR